MIKNTIKNSNYHFENEIIEWMTKTYDFVFFLNKKVDTSLQT